MKKKLFGLVVACGYLLFLAGCSDSESRAVSKQSYDPSKPVEAITFSPDSGGMRTKFIVKGSNFGTDVSKIQVLFNGNRKARVISANGNMIYCMVPKQTGGENTVAVVVEEDTCEMAQTFRYSVKEMVTTVTGKDENGGLVDGSLSESRFAWTCGIGLVTGDNLLIMERFDWRVRLASLNDNKVITLITGFSTGKPAVTKDGKTAFAIGYGHPHIIYRFDQRNLWAPRKLGELQSFFGNIQSCCLTPDEEWLYFRDNQAKFGRINIADPNRVELLNDQCGETPNGTDNHLLYHPQDDCFYMSIEFGHGIYRISKDGKNVSRWAGFNGQSNIDGYLDEASLTSPMGMAVDADGNIYVAQVQGHNIRKISYPERLVTSVAGSYGQGGGVDGEPIKARFRGPWDIVIDAEENFYITQFWGCSVRKLAIE